MVQERQQDRVPFKAPRLVFFVWCKLWHKVPLMRVVRREPQMQLL